MLAKIYDWFDLMSTFVTVKLLPMIALAAIGILVVQVVLKLTKKVLEKSKLEKAAHTLILTAIQVVLYILLGLAVASGLGIDVTGVVALASVLTLAVSLAIQNQCVRRLYTALHQTLCVGRLCGDCRTVRHREGDRPDLYQAGNHR